MTQEKKRRPAAAAAAGAAAAAAVGAATRVTRSEGVACRTIGGQEVVIVPSSRKLQVLNEVGTLVWSLCDGRSVRRIAAEVTRRYEVDRARALGDVARFVGELAARGMVVLG